MNEFDIAIVGGGMVGITLAQALSSQVPSLKIVLIEAKSSAKEEDNRAIALSHGSQRILEKYELWKKISPHALPLKQVHISDKGHFGITRFKSEEFDIEALGYVVKASILKYVFEDTFA